MEKFLPSLYKRWWIITLVVIISTVFTYAYSKKAIKPIYVSNVKLYVIHNQVVNDKSLNYDDIMASRQLINDYKEIINSDSVISKVLSDFNASNVPIEQFQNKIGVSSVNNTSVMQISVSDTSPTLAKQYADDLSQVFIDKIKELTKDNTISIVDYASMPDKPYNSNSKIYTLLAAVLSFVVCVSVIVAMDLLDNTIKDAEEVEKNYGLKVIGIVPNFKIGKGWKW